MLCVACKISEADQEHHLCYNPEIKIDICVECHEIVHRHGVGRGRGRAPELTPDEQHEVEKIQLYEMNNIPYKIIDGVAINLLM